MFLVVYVVLLNLLAHLAFAYDKHCARSGQWRVPEATLLLLALAGGSVGAYAAMKRFHHKTKKAVFSIGVPLLVAAHLIFASLYMLHY